MESVEVKLARIEEKQDQILEKLDERKTEIEDLEKRVESLEKWRAWILGASAAAGAVASQIWHQLTK